MDPADLLQQAQEVLQTRLAEAARFEGHEAYAEAQPHANDAKAALSEAQKHITAALDRMKTAQAEAQVRAAEAASRAQAAKDAATKAHAAAGKATVIIPPVAAADIPFEDAQGLDPKKVQEAIHVLLRGRAKKAAAEAIVDDRDLSEAWSDPEIPPEATHPTTAPPSAPETKPKPKPRPRPTEGKKSDDSGDIDMAIWEDLP
jgi:hypothetical protein